MDVGNGGTAGPAAGPYSLDARPAARDEAPHAPLDPHAA